MAATAALTVAVVGVLTVTVQAGSLDQLPQAVEVLELWAGSTLQVPQVVVELAGSALQVAHVVEEVDVSVGSALQVPQEVLLELLAAFFVGSALQLLQPALALAPKPPVAE